MPFCSLLPFLLTTYYSLPLLLSPLLLTTFSFSPYSLLPTPFTTYSFLPIFSLKNSAICLSRCVRVFPP